MCVRVSLENPGGLNAGCLGGLSLGLLNAALSCCPHWSWHCVLQQLCTLPGRPPKVFLDCVLLTWAPLALVYLEEELLHSMRVPSPKLGLLPLRPYLPRPTHLLRSLLRSLLDYALPALALLSVVPVYSDLWGNPHTPHHAYLPAAPWS